MSKAYLEIFSYGMYEAYLVNTFPFSDSDRDYGQISVIFSFLTLDHCIFLSKASMVWASRETSLRCRYCSSSHVQSDRTHICVLSYLRHLEELGIITSDDISDNVC